MYARNTSDHPKGGLLYPKRRSLNAAPGGREPWICRSFGPARGSPDRAIKHEDSRFGHPQPTEPATVGNDNGALVAGSPMAAWSSSIIIGRHASSIVRSHQSTSHFLDFLRIKAVSGGQYVSSVFPINNHIDRPTARVLP